MVRRCLDRGPRVYTPDRLDPNPAEDGFGLADYAERLPVPGSSASLLATAAAPNAPALQPWADFGASLGDPFAAAVYARIRRWIPDEFAQPERPFEDVLETPCRKDRLRAGTLEDRGRRTGLDRPRRPVLAVVTRPGAACRPLRSWTPCRPTCRGVRCTTRATAARRCDMWVRS